MISIYANGVGVLIKAQSLYCTSRHLQFPIVLLAIAGLVNSLI